MFLLAVIAEAVPRKSFQAQIKIVDHIGTSTYLDTLGIVKRRAKVLIILKPHNSPRKVGEVGVNDLGRPSNIIYMVATQDGFNPVEGLAPRILNFFNKIVKKTTRPNFGK